MDQCHGKKDPDLNRDNPSMVVDIPSQPRAGFSLFTTTSIDHSDHGCIFRRLGRPLQGRLIDSSSVPQSLEQLQRREKTPHKCSKVKSSATDSDASDQLSPWKGCEGGVRQLDNSCVYQPPGWHWVLVPEPGDAAVVQLGHSTSGNLVNSPPCRGRQCPLGLPALQQTS